MVGVIRKRDVMAHPLVTIQCFGWRVFLKTIVAGRHQTFLALLMEADVFDSRRDQIPELVERCVQLELRAARLYDSLAERFSRDAAVGDLFGTLAAQEREHAELLRLCREAASRGRWDEKRFEPFAAAVPRLEWKMEDAESTLGETSTLADALRLTVDIESSEVNRVFGGIVAASDSDFVKALDAFSAATGKHLSYINERVPAVVPDLKDACRIMMGQHAASRAIS